MFLRICSYDIILIIPIVTVTENMEMHISDTMNVARCVTVPEYKLM